MAAQDRFQGGWGEGPNIIAEAVLANAGGGGGSLDSGRLRSFSVCSNIGAVRGECTARARVKRKQKNFWSEKLQQQVEPSKVASLSPRPISHLVKMPLCDVLPFPFKCSSSSPLTMWDGHTLPLASKHRTPSYIRGWDRRDGSSRRGHLCRAANLSEFCSNEVTRPREAAPH